MRIIFIILSIFFIFLYCTSDKSTPPDNYGDNPNFPPYCEISFPDDGDTLIIGNIYISVDAYDNDGYIECIEFYIEDELVLIDRSEFHIYIDISPWIKSGTFEIKAIAIDDDSASTESVISAYFALFMPVNPSPDTLFVPQDYSLIQDAIDNSQDGDVIMIADGTYVETVHITHPLILTGNGENTVIDDRWISVESDRVIIRNIKSRGYGNHTTESDGSPGIIIGGDFVLLDNVFAYGGGCNSHSVGPPYPELYMCTIAGAGVEIENSSHVIIQNSDLRGGGCNEYYCDFNGQPGLGTLADTAISVFIVETRMEGDWWGNCIVASNYSYIGIKDCEIIGDLDIDSNSIIIFP